MAGAVAGAVSGAPSTGWALVRGDDPFEAIRAAGTLVLRRGSRPASRFVAGGLAHAVISAGWGVVLARALPRRRTPLWGAAAGLAIAALDLGVIGRRFPRVWALPRLPQFADHLAYGVTVGLVLARRRQVRTR